MSLSLCCDNFKTAIDEDTIKLIDYYEHQKSWREIERVKEPIAKGYYILDGYAVGEMCNENYPAKPQTMIKFCPYCGAQK